MSQSLSFSRQNPRNGEVWLVNIPNYPNDPHTPRPAVVVSTNGQNDNLELVLVIPMSTSIGAIANPSYHILISASESSTSHDSWARCELITSIDKTLMIRKLGGPVSNLLLHKMIEGVRRAMGDTIPPRAPRDRT